MGIAQNFNRNLKKSTKKQTPTLPAGDKFILQQLVKNIDEVEDMLERTGETVVVEYNVGDLKKVVRNLNEAKKCSYSFECKGGKICLKGRCKKNPHEKIVSPGTNHAFKHINKTELKEKKKMGGRCRSEECAGKHGVWSRNPGGRGWFCDCVNGPHIQSMNEKEMLQERKWCSNRKLGKSCDGGDGHGGGVWTNTANGCQCSYGGMTHDWDKVAPKTPSSDKSIELEVGEATTTASSGAYSTPRFWSKDKKNQKFSTQRWMPGAKYVKVKEKCKKFPYCNQGDINALEIWEKEIMRESAKNVSKKTGKPESEVREMIENELAEIIRRGLYKSPIKDLVGNKKMNTPIGKMFTMKGNKPKYEK